MCELKKHETHTNTEQCLSMCVGAHRNLQGQLQYWRYRGSAEAIMGVHYSIITNSWTHWPPLSISHFLSLFKTHCSFPHALAFSQMRAWVRGAQKHNPILGLSGELKTNKILRILLHQEEGLYNNYSESQYSYSCFNYYFFNYKQ